VGIVHPTFSGEKMSLLKNIIELALLEDIGTGDVTSDFVIPADALAEGAIVSKSEGIIAGLDVAAEVFHTIDSGIDFECYVSDGAKISPDQKLAVAKGFARSILKAERIVLNFLQRLSGIATNTSKYVMAASGYPVKIVDTRKTTPGWRILEKYAVRVGGGHNHRFGLYDAVLIKDNHIAVAGSIVEAVKRARKQVPFTMKIEVEVETIAQVKEAIESDSDIIMLDNMNLKMMREAVGLIGHKILVEASGGVRLENVAAIAATGVDIISIGNLTYGATPLDISMDMKSITNKVFYSKVGST